MHGTKGICLIVALAAFLPAVAVAKTDDMTIPAKARVHLVPPLQLADVVVNPNPAPAPAPVVPVAPAPAPVVEAPPASHTTYVEHAPHRSFMSTIALNAFMGGLAGALVGGAIYFLADNQTHPQRIAYWGAGGVLVGTTVGIIEVATEESRADRAVSTKLPTDPAPTVRLALFSQSF